MLLNVSVKNLALIKESDIYFKDGMNILSGETGAGKSIIIGSINIALGGKVNKEMVRSGEDYAMVELVFKVDRESTRKKLEDAGVTLEDGEVIVTRKIVNGRSITKVNGETFPVSALRDITALLIDIHGQHDHQSLLKVDKHIGILDEFAAAEISDVKNDVLKAYNAYVDAKNELEMFDMDEEQRIRECEFYNFEINEITDADLTIGEDNDIEESFKKVANMKKILESVSVVHNVMNGDTGENVLDMLGRAVSEMASVSDYDDSLKDIYNQLVSIEDLCISVSRDVSEYADSSEFDEERAKELEERLDLINHLKLKYGNTIEKILEYRDEKQQKLELLENYDIKKKQAQQKLDETEKILDKKCEKLSNLRKKYAVEFEKRVVETLEDLNFLQVKFKVDFKKSGTYSANGNDKAEFMISTNPGEPLMPLAKIASGGELSRIMLGIKTIMAGQDDIDTLIFDEIDTGISGRTAQKVAEQMKLLSKKHQIICITHLPQIAAMADNHLKIEKISEGNETSTKIYPLDEEKSVEELARMLGGAEITETVMQNAREMKKLAIITK
ncbi:MAG: DNA repair protein RecN [Lachnospiraceae bacterium]|nr:DNA repair protein RecN [Lachnospiraceae bacterium]MDD6858660.1 DNA repair protein RecN [Lachnospiraceae bacterium]